jgi:hypothetical protein
VHIFYDCAIEHFNRAEDIKRKNFPECASKSSKMIGEIHFLDVDADETHICYNEFLKLRMNAIIMLSTSVESFINHSIPNTYPNRARIERYCEFKEKLTVHLPESLGLIDYWTERDGLRNAIINLTDIRNNIIHLKTNSEEDFVTYFAVISQMLKFNFSKSLSHVREFMNSIAPDFIMDKESK